MLRGQLGGRRIRFTDAGRRRLAVLGKKPGRKALGEVATLATPDTILRWYRELVAKEYDGSARRGSGRPGTATKIARLVMRMASENPGWGYTRLRGALNNLGHEVGRNTIRRILQEQGIDPVPTRTRRYSWDTFIRAHLDAIAAADCFTVEVMGFAGLVRTYVSSSSTSRAEGSRSPGSAASQTGCGWTKWRATSSTRWTGSWSGAELGNVVRNR